MKRLKTTRMEKLQYIATLNGYDKCVDLMIEEMSELTQALLKERRLRNKTYTHENVLKYKNAKMNINEELADVNIMLSELLTFFNIGVISDIVEFKIERTLQNES